MKVATIRTLALGMLVGVAVTGCATPGTKHAYTGEARPLEELALILGTTNGAVNIVNPQGERISFSAVDDDSTVPWYSPAPYPTSVYVLPGRHKLDIEYDHVHGVARGSVWMNAMSNRIYQVKVMNPDERTQRVYFVLQDVTAQTLVGGQEVQAQPVAPVVVPAVVPPVAP